MRNLTFMIGADSCESDKEKGAVSAGAETSVCNSKGTDRQRVQPQVCGSDDLAHKDRKTLRTNGHRREQEDVLVVESNRSGGHFRAMVSRSLKKLRSSCHISAHQYARILERATKRVR